MILKTNITEAVRSLASAKQRTVLALIGIVIGIGSVIAMVSVGKIVQGEALRQFMELGTDLLTVEKGQGARTQQGKKLRVVPLKLAEVLAIPEKCLSISVAAPSVSAWGGDISHSGKKLPRVSVLGVTESFAEINKLKVKEGRFISDMDEQSHYCVIGNDVRKELLKSNSGDIIGRQIRFGDAVLTVIGSLEEVAPGGMRRFEPNETLYIHLTTALRVVRDPDISITARVRPGITNTVAKEQVQAYFATLKKEMRVSSPEEIIAQMEKQMQMFTLLLGAIGSISLIVGGVGVMNVMLVSVTERRREIGIRRALGARRGDIKGQFLIESIILSLVGGLCGIVIGVGVARIIAHFAKWQFLLSGGAILLGVGVATAVGIFFGFYPARQASLLDPIVALRSE